MQELKDKVVLVTGGSRGLGRQMVHAFAAGGARVVIASRNLASCEAVAEELSEKYGTEALPVAVNVGDWDQCDALVDAAYAAFGRVDVLVNNAGLSPHYPELSAVSRELFDKVLNVNLRGPFRLCALIGERMAGGDGGSIINIGSIEAVRPHDYALPYAAAKAGLHVLTEGFAQAYGPSVRVNTIQAGPFLTDIADNWKEGQQAEIEGLVALRRCAQPEEIVGAALYFATSASSFTTGAVLRVDGGWR